MSSANTRPQGRALKVMLQTMPNPSPQDAADLATAPARTDGALSAAARNRTAGADGFPDPDTSGFLRLRADKSGRETLSACGIRIAPGADLSNTVLLHPDLRRSPLKLDFGRTRDNLVVLGHARRISGAMHFTGNANTCVLYGCKMQKGRHGSYTLSLRVVGEGCTFYAGPNTTMGGVNAWLQGAASTLLIGEDCMLSWDVMLRTGDAHSVIDVGNREVTNLARDLLIGPHVWLGYDVHVMKGVEIGAGSLVSSMSVVTRSIPPLTAAAGIPAKPIRSGTTWSRAEHATPEQIEEILARPYLAVHAPAP
ncbi:acyltransferase [Paroceanicella profunda]|uniref:Acyltransferase n=1 Tax=Paroceanicella profunda TaxID=2579971 RepID=A0A5B8G0S6_9RHOB|nr:acyltransferase [Paroceanicella profunda]QDL93400.1 acyltransferase [Paroceanicella profunda]